MDVTRARVGELILRFEGTGTEEVPFVLGSLSGWEQGCFRSPFDADEVHQHLPRATSDELCGWGRQLHAALFGGKAGRLLEQTRRTTGDNGLLHLRISADLPEHPLWTLPWELLTVAQEPMPLTVTRSLKSSMPCNTTEIALPLLLLIAEANPPGPNRLFLRQEQSLIRRVLEESGANLQILEDVTPKTMRSALGETRAHVLHFMGHGTEEGLCFYDSRGDQITVNGIELAGNVPQPAPGLIVLSACRSGSAGVGAALAARLGSAVLAMQFPIHDECMPFFFEQFYRFLSDGSRPSEALYEARLGLRMDYPQSPDWCCPVLYQHRETRLSPGFENGEDTASEALGRLISGIKGIAPAQSKFRVREGRRDEPGGGA